MDENRASPADVRPPTPDRHKRENPHQLTHPGLMALLPSEEVNAVRRRIDALVRELKGILTDITAGAGETIGPGERRISSRYAAVKARIVEAHERAARGRRPSGTAADRVYWERAVHEASASLCVPVNCSRRETLARSISAALETLRRAISRIDDAHQYDGA